MAGVTPLLIESDGTNHSVPNHFETVSFFLKEANVATGDDILFQICERETVVDSINIRGTTTDANIAFSFKKAADGVAIASGQAFASATGLTTEVKKAATIDTAHNIIEAGSVIGVDITDGSATVDNLIITMRIRTQL
tara:strand:+ start:293 stop:706 length:414 start_codon:yes stop_codon:yes gene_type:complete